MSDPTSNIGTFFATDDASSAVVLAAAQVVAPMIVGTDLADEEVMMGGGLRVVYFIIDRSPSMKPVAAALMKGFNQDFVPAVKNAREDDISALRIGGNTFSSDITPVWRGTDGSYFHSIDQLPPLTLSDFNPAKGWGTALHQAILDGTATAISYAAKLQQDTGMDVDVDIIVLTDGENNEPPRDAAPVRQIITGRDRSRVRYVLFYFQTEYGNPNPEAYATQDLGIDGEQVMAFLAAPGESAEDMARRFRRAVQVMSRVSAARNTSAVVATSLVDEDELI